MNKEEIAEIRKPFTQERCTRTRICSCYVDGEKMADRIRDWAVEMHAHAGPPFPAFKR